MIPLNKKSKRFVIFLDRIALPFVSYELLLLQPQAPNICPSSRDRCRVLEGLDRAARDTAEVVYAGEVGDLDSAAAYLSLQTLFTRGLFWGVYQATAMIR